MQFPARPDDLAEPALHRTANVLVTFDEGELPVLRLRSECLEPVDHGMGIVGFNDGGRAQHRHVGDRAGDVVEQKALVPESAV